MENTIGNTSNDILMSPEILAGNTSLPDNLSGALAQPGNVTQFPQVDSASFSWGDYMNALVVVFFMLFLLYGVLWLLRKYGKGRILPVQGGFKRENLKVEAQLGLAPKKQLMVVKYFNKRLLIGITDQNMILLSEDLIEEPRNIKEDSMAFERFIAEAEKTKPTNNTQNKTNTNAENTNAENTKEAHSA